MYKIASITLGVLMGAVALTAYAATPTVTCTGTVIGQQITWSAAVNGGVSPFTYAWSNGATTSSQISNNNAPGLYSMTVAVTDASSTMGTTSCSATVVAATTTPPTPPVPPICQATSSVPVMVNTALNIGPRGNVEVQGMKVVSVGAGSFTGSVWGVTYTVMSTKVVTVGNYVSLTGNIATSSPLVINARTVREQSSMKIKHNEDCQKKLREISKQVREKEIMEKKKNKNSGRDDH